MKNILKTQVDWKSQTPMNLVDALHLVVKHQEKNIARAIIGQGDLYLCKEYEHFKININTWNIMTAEQRERHLNKFYRATTTIDRIVVSSAGVPVIAPTHGRKKPHQVRRARAERATTTTKKQRL